MAYNSYSDMQSVYTKLDQRHIEISERYGIPPQVLNFDLSTVRAVDFYEYCCCDLIESPEFFLCEGHDATCLPESVKEYSRISGLLHNEARRICTGVQIGERLRRARKAAGLTGEAVVEKWMNQTDYNGTQCKTTQATVSNHERGKVSSIRLIDLLIYCTIYNTATTPDEIMLGCSYEEMLNEIVAGRHKESVNDSLNIERVLSGDQYNEHFRKLLIIMAGEKCERCKQRAPFYDLDGVPYLLLKVLPSGNNMQEGVLFTNAVVLCPNCYSRVEVLQEDKDIKDLQEIASHHSLAELYKHAEPDL